MDELYAEPRKVRIFPMMEDSCPECGAVHDAKLPHYCGSVYYQMRFTQKTGKWPVWSDAMAHCSRKVQDEFTSYLRESGVPDEEIFRNGRKEGGRGR